MSDAIDRAAHRPADLLPQPRSRGCLADTLTRPGRAERLAQRVRRGVECFRDVRIADAVERARLADVDKGLFD